MGKKIESKRIIVLLTIAYIFALVGTVLIVIYFAKNGMKTDIKEIKNIPFYHSESEPLRIELVYAANKKIKPLNIKNRDTPCFKLN